MRTDCLLLQKYWESERGARMLCTYSKNLTSYQRDYALTNNEIRMLKLKYLSTRETCPAISSSSQVCKKYD